MTELWPIALNGAGESVSQSVSDEPRYRAVFTAKKQQHENSGFLPDILLHKITERTSATSSLYFLEHN